MACMVFVGSAFVPSQRLGLLLGLGFIAAVVGDLWILRGLLRAPGRSAGATQPRAQGG
jgi:hypothetical protein